MTNKAVRIILNMCLNETVLNDMLDLPDLKSFLLPNVTTAGTSTAIVTLIVTLILGQNWSAWESKYQIDLKIIYVKRNASRFNKTWCIDQFVLSCNKSCLFCPIYFCPLIRIDFYQIVILYKSYHEKQNQRQTRMVKKVLQEHPHKRNLKFEIENHPKEYPVPQQLPLKGN